MDGQKEDPVSKEKDLVQSTVELVNGDKTGDEGASDTVSDSEPETAQLKSQGPDEEDRLEESAQDGGTGGDKAENKKQTEEGKGSEEKDVSPGFGVLPDEDYEGTKSEGKLASGEVEEEIDQAGNEGGEQDDQTKTEEAASVEARVDKVGKSAKESEVEGKDEPEKKNKEGLNFDLRLTHKKASSRKSAPRLVVGIAAAMFLITLSLVFFMFIPKPVSRHETEKELPANGQVLGADASSRKRYKVEHQSRIDQKLSKVEGLIRALKDKQANLSNVKQHYQAGIKAVENEILEEIVSGRLGTFQDALNEKKIELHLLTIQRRQVYIQALERLVRRLVQDREALLFVKRRIEIDKQMVNIIQGMNMNQLVARMDLALQQHLHDDDKLKMDTKDVNPQALKAIWEGIYAKGEKSRIQSVDFSGEGAVDHEIWREICDGNFERMHELTRLSPAAAKCLSEWKGKDLFLSKLTQLSPEAAKYLSRWKGRWLSLNGLSELYPETAKYLSQWQGSRLSLNGLKEVSPDVVVYLYQWKGKELELVSLNNINRWEKSGKRVHLADKYRKK